MVKATPSIDTNDLFLRDYDVILIGIDFPVTNGINTTKAIRQTGYIGLIIGMTTNMSSDEVQDFFEANATHIVVKPFRVATVQAILDLH